jgi:hypothetical protein
MISNHLFTIKPPKELLDQCVEVIVCDPKERLYNIKKWGRENCHSFLWMDEVDTSDVSPLYDVCCAFYFWDERDVLIFKMKYAEWI